MTGTVQLESVVAICPGCGQQVEAIARDGEVKGYCSVSRTWVVVTQTMQAEPVKGK